MGGRAVALIFAILVALFAVIFWLLPEVDERLRPEPRAAWVGIEIDGSGVAEVGRVSPPPGTEFRLHAILEAEKQNGGKVYFTEAKAIDFGDGQITEGVRTWNGVEAVRLLWLTLEGAVPYLQLPAGRDLDNFRFEDFLQPGWGRGWTAPGDLRGRNADQLEGSDRGERGFGTQHYQVWVELFGDEKAIVPDRRFKSPGYDELAADPNSFATVVVELAGPLGPPSRVFGLPQIELAEDSPAELQQKLAELFARGVAFDRLLVLRSIMERARTRFEDLVWQRLDLAARVSWGESVMAGDLLRVGARWVVLFEDSRSVGASGVLDPSDLCLDFDRGSAVKPLAEVFVGSGDVEWSRPGANR